MSVCPNGSSSCFIPKGINRKSVGHRIPSLRFNVNFNTLRRKSQDSVSDWARATYVILSFWVTESVVKYRE